MLIAAAEKVGCDAEDLTGGNVDLGDRASPDGTLYVNYCTGTAELQGIWRIKRGGTPVQIAALPPTSVPNGLALDRHTGYL